MNLGKQEVRKCPCNDVGCKSWVVWPLFDRAEASSRDKEMIEEVVRRLNAGETEGGRSE